MIEGRCWCWGGRSAVIDRVLAAEDGGEGLGCEARAAVACSIASSVDISLIAVGSVAAVIVLVCHCGNLEVWW